MPSDEEVLVIPTEHFRAVGSFHGFQPAHPAFQSALLDPAQFSFRPRSTVETDANFKQLIPYVLLRFQDELFQYRRGSTGTEKRLAALRSVGIGGHISKCDAEEGNPYTVGMQRELREEVTIGCGYRESFLGFINDDRTFVGQVHLGIVHVFHLDLPSVRSNEAALIEGGFHAISKLWQERESFETWSQFALEALQRE